MAFSLTKGPSLGDRVSSSARFCLQSNKCILLVVRGLLWVVVPYKRCDSQQLRVLRCPKDAKDDADNRLLAQTPLLQFVVFNLLYLYTANPQVVFTASVVAIRISLCKIH